jgi:amidase
MAGPADGDPYWAPPPKMRFAEAPGMHPRKLRLASLSETSLAEVDAEVRAAFQSACDTFRSLGHVIEPVKLDPAAMLKDIAQKLICAGISSIPVKNPELMDPVVRAAWERGRGMTAAEYISTVAQMHNVSRAIVQALLPYDALLTPTLPRPALELGSLYGDAERAMESFFGWIPFTYPFNATGQPALSIPNGFSSAGLPIGLQIVGRPADEVTIIGLAAAFEEARPWRDRHPPVD